MAHLKKWWTEKFGRVKSTKLICKKSLLIPMTDTKKDHWVDVKITKVNKVLGHFYSVDTLSGHYSGKKLIDVLYAALIGECENVIKSSNEGVETILKK